MLHVFYVQSYITYYISLSIIKYKNLISNDVLFITTRGQQVEYYNSIELPKIVDEIVRGKSFVEIWYYIRKFDKEIEKIFQNRSFHIYLPHSLKYSNKLIKTHKKCQGYSYIEEGAGSYIEINKINEKYKNHFLSRNEAVGYYGRIKNCYIMEDDYEYVYSFFDEAFPNYRNKIVLKQFIGENNSFLDTSVEKFNNSKIIVLDAISSLKFVNHDAHLYGFNEQLEQLYLEDSKSKLFIKFHPNQDKGERNLFKAIIEKYSSKGFIIEEINDGVALEDIILKGKSLTFYVNISSIALYAHFNKHTVYSFAKYIVEKFPSYQNHLNRLPQILKLSCNNFV